MEYLTGDDIEIVISAENNTYCGWQCLLAHYSCKKNLNITPLIVVHGAPHIPLHRHFQTLIENGGRVQEALNYRCAGTQNYMPRNTAGTLLNVKTSAPYIMLCDSDFLFMNPIPRDALPNKDNEITFDYIGFMKVTNSSKDDLLEPARKAGVDLDQLVGAAAGGAVPHIIPSSLARPLAVDWLKCIEFFATSKDPILWIASMWGLVFAVQRLELEPSITKIAITDSGQTTMVDINGDSAPKILHYSYGNEHFTKRDYTVIDASLWSSVWDVKAPDGTMSKFICDYLNEVKRQYHISYSLKERLQGNLSYLYFRRSLRNFYYRFK